MYPGSCPPLDVMWIPAQIDDAENLHRRGILDAGLRAEVEDRAVVEIVVGRRLPTILVAVVVMHVPARVADVEAVVDVAAVGQPAVVVVDVERPASFEVGDSVVPRCSSPKVSSS